MAKWIVTVNLFLVFCALNVFNCVAGEFLNEIPLNSFFIDDLHKPSYQIVHTAPQLVGGPSIQQYLTQMFDWNFHMPPDEFDFNCKHRMYEIEQMTVNVTKNDFFYEGNSQHMQLVMDISTALNNEPSANDALTFGMCMRDVVNPIGWVRGMHNTMATGRNDLRGFYVQPVMEVVPSGFMYMESIGAAGQQANRPPGARECVPVNGAVGRDNGIENVLWYWREDIQLNMFHWYWHLSYPFMGQDPRADRRGELFYYLHHSIVARYRIERMSVGLPRLVPLELFPGQVVEEPYNSHLTDTNSANNWTPRQPNRVIADTNTRVVEGPAGARIIRPEERLAQLQAIEEAIQTGFALSATGQPVPLRTARGIDILGDMVEAAIWTVNQDLYGYPGPHNDGHFLLGLIEDQTGFLGLPPGVMADPATAMRDPIFYRYHLPIDAIFNRHKITLPPYQLFDGEFPLVFPGVRVTGFGIKALGSPPPPNQIETFFVDQVFDVSRGLDFNGTGVDGPILACAKHLDYQKFSYEIEIERGPGATERATIRIFIAPRFNELGERFNMEDQRLLFVQLDRFPVTLTAGINRIIRASTDSTLTIPAPQSLLEFQSDLTNETPFCGCGWPEHLLMPRGSIEGQEFDLFVIVTDGDIDAVQFTVNIGPGVGCRPAPIFCGIADQSYPDSRPMGYPFDRLPYAAADGGGIRPVQDIEEYTAGIPNSGVVQIRILHRGGDEEASAGVGLGGGGIGLLGGVGGGVSNNLELQSFLIPYRHRYSPFFGDSFRKR